MKDDVGYRKRSVVESFYSSFKRQFGEHVQNRNWTNIVEELYLKIWLYNLWVSLSPEAS